MVKVYMTYHSGKICISHPVIGFRCNKTMHYFNVKIIYIKSSTGSKIHYILEKCNAYINSLRGIRRRLWTEKMTWLQKQQSIFIITDSM